jgi:hypothetical protein
MAWAWGPGVEYFELSRPTQTSKQTSEVAARLAPISRIVMLNSGTATPELRVTAPNADQVATSVELTYGLGDSCTSVQGGPVKISIL